MQPDLPHLVMRYFIVISHYSKLINEHDLDHISLMKTSCILFISSALALIIFYFLGLKNQNSFLYLPITVQIKIQDYLCIKYATENLHKFSHHFLMAQVN